MKKDRKKYYIGLGILIIYFIVMLVVFIIPAILKSGIETYILIDNYEKWQYNGDVWKNITDKSKYNWQKFDIYEDNKYVGNYNALFNETWHFYDDDNKPVKIDSTNMIAIRSNRDYAVADFTEREITSEEMKYVNEILKEKDITTNDFTSSSVIDYDLDHDLEDEKIFTISNVFTENISDKLFNFVFVVNDEKIMILAETVADFSDMYDNCKMYVSKIVDTNGDDKYEIITGCGYYSDTENCFEMYELDNNEYQKIKACE